MTHPSVRVIRQEHAALVTVLRVWAQMQAQGPGDAPEHFFDLLRAMLFYLDEFGQRQHHPRETSVLFPRVARVAPETTEALTRLDAEHARAEAEVRALQHLLLAWELLGEPRRAAFVAAATLYQTLYFAHIQLEESLILPAAQRALTPEDWLAVDAAFDNHPRATEDWDSPSEAAALHGPELDRLYTRIVISAPQSMGLHPALEYP